MHRPHDKRAVERSSLRRLLQPKMKERKTAMKRATIASLAVAASALALGLAGQISPARAAAVCNCHPLEAASCPKYSFCKPGHCKTAGAAVGRCVGVGGGGGDPKSPTNSFSADPGQAGAKAVKPARKLRPRAKRMRRPRAR